MSAQPGRRHIYEADVLRVLTFACVIAVHTTSETTATRNVSANSIVMLLHFTREAFFCLTGFVLVHQYLGRTFTLGRFWWRKIVTVGAPYVTWTVIYTFLNYEDHPIPGPGEVVLTLLKNLALGTAWYHMYFLLVSMQIYLIYPLIANLLKRTAGRHGQLLAASAVLQVAILTGVMYAAPSSGFAHALVAHDAAIFVSYQFYILLGAVAAFHWPAWLLWIRTHRPAVAAGVVGSAALAEAWYFAAVHNGRLAADAAAVLQPVMLPWAVAAIAGLVALSTLWTERRRENDRLTQVLGTLSDRSFGVFLCHPAVLWFILWADSGWLRSNVTAPWLTIVAYSLTVVGALAVTDVLRRLPISLALTGRPPMQPIARREVSHTPPRKDVDHALDNTQVA
jgi:peptidoglycan/LPS O-acetylase OafA/YrhL